MYCYVGCAKIFPRQYFNDVWGQKKKKDQVEKQDHLDSNNNVTIKFMN